MKAFVFALVIFMLTLGLCTVNDIYCHSVCENINTNVASKTEKGASDALAEFKRNEFLLNCSVDNGYVNEARVSLESLIVAYALQDEYEIKRYSADCIVRVNRIKTALFI